LVGVLVRVAKDFAVVEDDGAHKYRV
jgi:hypothetical protein